MSARDASGSGATILVNGKPHRLAATTLAGVLDELGHDPASHGVAVALNGEVVPRGRWVEHTIRPGDRVEIVGAVQGG